MFPRKMYSALGPCDVRQDSTELPGLVIRTDSACPLIFVPTFCHTTFEIFTHAGVDQFNLLECEVNTLPLRHSSDSPRVQADRERLQNSARPRLLVGYIPHLADGQVGRGKPTQALVTPKSLSRLQEDFRA